jgi:hypothetical protein
LMAFSAAKSSAELERGYASVERDGREVKRGEPGVDVW